MKILWKDFHLVTIELHLIKSIYFLSIIDYYKTREV